MNIFIISSIIFGIAVNLSHGYSVDLPSFSQQLPKRKLSISFTNLQDPEPVEGNVCNSEDSFQYENKCYIVSREKLNWNDAYQHCQKDDSKLLEILSGNEYFAIIDQFNERNFKESYWVGACRVNEHADWSWIINSTAVFPTFWARTFVNGRYVTEPQQNYYENCALLDATRFHFMNPAQCHIQHKFICEKEVENVIPVEPELKPELHVDVYFSGEDESTFTPSCPENWTLREGSTSCYRANPAEMSFEDAENFCNSYNATLVAITTKEEDKFIAEFSSVEAFPSSFWIGACHSKGQNFHWTTEEEFEYHSLDLEQLKNLQYGQKACLEFVSENGSWIDTIYSPFTKRSFMCELEAFNNA